MIQELTTDQLITEIVGGEPYKYYPLGQYVVRAPGICGGRPTFKYTRIEITFILQQLAMGEAIENIVTSYYHRFSKEAVLEAINIVTNHFAGELSTLEPVQ